MLYNISKLILRSGSKMNLKSFMKMGGEEFEIIRNDKSIAEVEGLPNREEKTARPYIGFYDGTDIYPGDWVKGKISNDMLFIEDTQSTVVQGKVFQIKGYYLTEAQYSKQKRDQQKESRPSIVYNLYGAHSKVNNHSTDNSINIVDMSSIDLFDEIRNILKETIVNQDELANLRVLVNDMESNQNTKGFIKAYQNFINSAASHMTALSPFIPALTQMMQG